MIFNRNYQGRRSGLLKKIFISAVFMLSCGIKAQVYDFIDKPFYKYVVSNEAYQAAHNNPFAEPVQVYTNITGGFGIFSGYSFSSQRLLLFGKGIKE